MADQPTTKKFAKGERSVPHHSQKASKYYPADDAAVPKKVRSMHATLRQRDPARKRRIFASPHAKLSLRCPACEFPSELQRLPHTRWNLNTDSISRLARPSARPRFASLSLPAPSSSSSLVASAASVSSSSSTSSRVSSSSPVPSKSTAFPSEG